METVHSRSHFDTRVSAARSGFVVPLCAEDADPFTGTGRKSRVFFVKFIVAQVTANSYRPFLCGYSRRQRISAVLKCGSVRLTA